MEIWKVAAFPNIQFGTSFLWESWGIWQHGEISNETGDIQTAFDSTKI